MQLLESQATQYFTLPIGKVNSALINDIAISLSNLPKHHPFFKTLLLIVPSDRMMLLEAAVNDHRGATTSLLNIFMEKCSADVLSQAMLTNNKNGVPLLSRLLMPAHYNAGEAQASKYRVAMETLLPKISASDAALYWKSLLAQKSKGLYPFIQHVAPKHLSYLMTRYPKEELDNLFLTWMINGQVVINTGITVFLNALTSTTNLNTLYVLLSYAKPTHIEQALTYPIKNYSGGSLLSAVAEKSNQKKDNRALQKLIYLASPEALTRALFLQDKYHVRCIEELFENLSPILHNALIKKVSSAAIHQLMGLMAYDHRKTIFFEAVDELNESTLALYFDKVTPEQIQMHRRGLPTRLQAKIDRTIKIRKDSSANKIALETSPPAAQETRQPTANIMLKMEQAQDASTQSSPIKYEDYLHKLERIHQEYRDQGMSSYNKNDIQSRVEIAQTEGHLSPEILMPIVMRAVYMAHGFMPRDTQIVAVLMMLRDSEKGALSQIATGEGKSVTVAMLAIINCIRHKKVDVITSSKVLAVRDSQEQKPLYDIFGISVSHNTLDKTAQIVFGAGNYYKDCYLADIVYGDLPHFQWDYLAETVQFQKVRQRPYQSVIVDEVDSLLVDGFSNIARIGNVIAGSDYLGVIFLAVWQQLIRIKKNNAVANNHSKEHMHKLLTQYIHKIIEAPPESVHIPEHLKAYALSQAKPWATSAILALYDYVNGQDYVITANNEGVMVVSPVDYQNTGVTNINTTWNDGLHQFLHLKHDLQIPAISTCGSFVSNVSFVKQYSDPIRGLTGTLGSQATQKLLKSIYNVDLMFIPTFKARQLTLLPGLLVDSEKTWQATVVRRTFEEAEKGRAVLLICPDINGAYQLREALTASQPHQIERIKLYTRSDVIGEAEHVQNMAHSGDIYVATNLAGRGTDIKLSNAVLTAGGLYVVETFLPTNKRVEDQAFGRAARAGQVGSAQLIISKHAEIVRLKKQSSIERDITSISQLKSLRDEIEEWRLERIELVHLKRVLMRDALFQQYASFKRALYTNWRMTGTDRRNAFMLNMDEQWGMYLKQKLNPLIERIPLNEEHIRRHYLAFEGRFKRAYNDNEITDNPFYEFNGLSSTFSSAQGMKRYASIIHASPLAAANARYRRAFCTIHQDNKARDTAIADLNSAKKIIEYLVIPHFATMMAVAKLNPEATVNDSPLLKQIENKIHFHYVQMQYIEAAIQTLKEAPLDAELTPAHTQDIYDLRDHLDMSDRQFNQMMQMGVGDLIAIHVDEHEDTPWLSIIGGLMIAGVQIAIGIRLIEIMPKFGAIIGTAFISEGVGDALFTLESALHDRFDFSEYGAHKAVSAAITLVCMGIDAAKINSTQSPSQLTSKAINKNSAKKITNAVIAQQIKQRIVSYATGFIIDAIADECLRQLKKDIQVKAHKELSNYFNPIDKVSVLNCARTRCGQNELMQIANAQMHKLMRKDGMVIRILKGVLQRQGGALKAAVRLYNIAEIAHNIDTLMHDFCNEYLSCLSILAGNNEMRTSNAVEAQKNQALFHNLSVMIANQVIDMMKGAVVHPIAHGLLDEQATNVLDVIHDVLRPSIDDAPRAQPEVRPIVNQARKKPLRPNHAINRGDETTQKKASEGSSKALIPFRSATKNERHNNDTSLSSQRSWLGELGLFYNQHRVTDAVDETMDSISNMINPVIRIAGSTISFLLELPEKNLRQLARSIGMPVRKNSHYTTQAFNVSTNMLGTVTRRVGNEIIYQTYQNLIDTGLIRPPTSLETQALRTTFNMVSIALPSLSAGKGMLTLSANVNQTLLLPSLSKLMVYAQSNPLTNSLAFQYPLMKRFTFRGVPTKPVEAFTIGWERKGIINLRQHILGESQHGYVSASKLYQIPMQPEFGGQPGSYVYVIHNGRKCADVNKILGKTPFHFEHEISVLKHIDPSDIVGGRMIGKDGRLTGPFVRNPNYDPSKSRANIRVYGRRSMTASLTRATEKTFNGVRADPKMTVPLSLTLFGEKSRTDDDHEHEVQPSLEM